MLSGTGELVAEARAAGRGVGAFNVVTLEHAEAIVAGAEAAGTPVICQISENTVRFHGRALAPLARGTAALAEAATVPVALHLDHVTQEALLHEAPDRGFGSVMFDASALPHEANLAATRAAAAWAHRRGLWVEAELGEVGGKDGVHAAGARTDPEQARAFVAATGVDALAVAVGSSHGMTRPGARLDHGLIGRLAAALPGTPLVLHGSSGVPEPELARAVAGGMAKINVGTALNAAYSRAVRDALIRDPELADPRGPLTAARAAMDDTIKRMLLLLWSPDAPPQPR
ncbi:class II fructose-bisphosphate aldolase [Streptomyces sp. 4N509B]|uniref:class II fructose-bisphosphate aldolase n=1 Tax=Streptomyces sp. 4N509B TaxID=3457413 RepID=UPI003FD6548C